MYQFLASTVVLTPSSLQMDMGYNAIIAIQSSAFLMTLNRKNIIVWQTHFKFYTAALILSAAYMVYGLSAEQGVQFAALFLCVAWGAFQIRIKTGISKYAIWAIVALTMSYAQGGASALTPANLLSLDSVRF